MGGRVAGKAAAGLMWALIVGGCSEGSPTSSQLVASRPTLDIVSGNGQRALAGTELPSPLVVRVRDASGGPVAGQVVNFRVTSGGGFVYAGVAMTDASGTAQEYWTIGSTAGSAQAVEVRAVDNDTGDPIVYGTFTAVAEGAVASVTLAPSSWTVEVGDSTQFVPTLRDAEGNTLTRPVTWTSSNPAVATVDASGMVHSRTGGTVTITATSEGRSGTATLVVEAHVASVTVEPHAATLRTLESRQYTATVRDRMNNVLTGRTVTWQSSSTAIATVTPSGMVTGRVPGTATITATSEGVTGFTTVRVSAF